MRFIFFFKKKEQVGYKQKAQCTLSRHGRVVLLTGGCHVQREAGSLPTKLVPPLGRAYVQNRYRQVSFLIASGLATMAFFFAGRGVNGNLKNMLRSIRLHTMVFDDRS